MENIPASGEDALFSCWCEEQEQFKKMTVYDYYVVTVVKNKCTSGVFEVKDFSWKWYGRNL